MNAAQKSSQKKHPFRFSGQFFPPVGRLIRIIPMKKRLDDSLFSSLAGLALEPDGEYRKAVLRAFHLLLRGGTK